MEAGRWFSLVGTPRVHPDRIEADAVIPDDSPFFDGHFPEQPVVPGIAILALVDRTLQEAPAGRGRPVGFRRVKFRKLAGSGGSFTIAIVSRSQSSDEGASELHFEVTSGGEIISDGVAIVTGIGGGS